MDNYDEIISSLYDGELDGDSTSKAIELFSKDQNISKKIALYGVISAANNLSVPSIIKDQPIDV